MYTSFTTLQTNTNFSQRSWDSCRTSNLRAFVPSIPAAPSTPPSTCQVAVPTFSSCQLECHLLRGASPECVLSTTRTQCLIVLIISPVILLRVMFDLPITPRASLVQYAPSSAWPLLMFVKKREGVSHGRREAGVWQRQGGFPTAFCTTLS